MNCRATYFSLAVLALWLLLSAPGLASDAVDIQTSRHSARELQEKVELEQLVQKFDLSKYTFTRKVTVEERAMNHAFPVLTLNVHFLGSDDELLSSFLHEQLHWYLAQHRLAMEDAVRRLKIMYPHAPVGLPAGADTEYSTYGHLVDCYLEIQADRELIGRERTDKVIKSKPWYTWIYKTVVQDEERIAALVKAERLEMNKSASPPDAKAEHFEPNEHPLNSKVVMPWEIPCKEEIAKSNFDLTTEKHLTGELKDPTGAMIDESPVVLRKEREDGKFVEYRTAMTDRNGRFDLRTIEPGHYRFLPGPNRGYKQPTKVVGEETAECEIKLVLQLNPTDQPFAGCPIN